MTESEWELLRWEVRSINDRGCSIMAALGGADEVVRLLPLEALLSEPGDTSRLMPESVHPPTHQPRGQRDNTRAPSEGRRVKLLFA